MKHNAKKRTLRLEQLENRELLSATTWDNAAQADAAVAAEMAATLNETAPIELPALSMANLDAQADVEVRTSAELVAAVQNVAEGGVIKIAEGAAIELEDDLVIAKSLTIVGDATGENKPTINVPGGTSISVSGADVVLTVQGISFEGGGNPTFEVKNNGTVDISSCVVQSSNQAFTLDDGHFLSEGNRYIGAGVTFLKVDGASTLYMANDLVTAEYMILDTVSGHTSKFTIVNSTWVAGAGTGNYANQNAMDLNGASLTLRNSIVLGKVYGAKKDKATVDVSNVLICGSWSNLSGDQVNVVEYDASQPLFVKGDYRLAAGSQAINAGNNAYVDDYKILKDLANNNRIAGNSVDLGAYEYGAGPYVDSTPLNAPTLTAQTLSASEITLTFGDLDSNASGYVYQFSTTDGAWSDDAWISAELSDAGTLTVDGLAANTTYYFVAKAVGTGDYVDSEVSVLASAKTMGLPTTPGPIEFGSYDPATGWLEMNWGASENHDRYRVESVFGSDLSEDADWRVFNISGDETSRIAKLGYPAQTVTFRVRAENEAGLCSDWVYATYIPGAPTTPGPIEFGSYDPATGWLEMNWGSSENHDRYRVESVFGSDLSEDADWRVFNISGDETSRIAKIGYPAQTVTFRVRAENEAGLCSDWVYATYEPVAPIAPTTPGPIEFGSYDPATGWLEMNWGASENHDRYRVESVFGSDLSEDADWRVFNISGDETSRIAKIGYPAQTVTFRVRAENEAKLCSDWVYATYEPVAPIAPTTPGPIEFGSYDPATGWLEMSWGSSENHDRYRVESVFGSDLSEDADWRVFNISGDETSRIAKLGYPAQTVTFRVRAENEAKLCSDWVYATYEPEASDIVSKAFMDFFAENELEDDFWFEFKQALGGRMKK